MAINFSTFALRWFEIKMYGRVELTLRIISNLIEPNQFILNQINKEKIMKRIEETKVNKNVVRWLYFGVFMLMVQILLGGITRLTESGLSITEWKPITGALPPLNTAQWQLEFDKYKNTDQFRYIHADF
ncbi:MAG TPA: COX15/CtaA family protein, partial [Hanamia sp.]|nr:COX15/CtaA family protein [Hanamia sp.]